MAADHLPIVETPPVPPAPGAPDIRVAVMAWRDEADTEAFARALAAQPALRDAFVALHGDLGAGKTTFVRHLLRALGIAGRIKSPTYAVVEPHETPDGLTIHHFDFYRFGDPREWDDAGFRDIFAAGGLKLAEWPDNAAGRLPVADLDLRIDARADDSRQVTLEARTTLGLKLLATLADTTDKGPTIAAPPPSPS